MTYDGQNLDILTGLLALLLAPLSARDARWARAFNLIGFALLPNVIRVVVMSSPFPFAWDLSPRMVLAAYAPYHLVGPVCVAGALAGHLILHAALATAAPGGNGRCRSCGNARKLSASPVDASIKTGKTRQSGLGVTILGHVECGP